MEIMNFSENQNETLSNKETKVIHLGQRILDKMISEIANLNKKDKQK